MAHISLTNAQIYLNEVDLTGDTNTVNIEATAAELDVSTFGDDGWMNRIGGPKSVSFNMGGWWGFEQPDAETFDHVANAQSDPALTLAVDDAAGSVAYLLRPTVLERQAGGVYGDPGTWSMAGMSRAGQRFGVYRGGISIAKQTVTGVVSGTGFQLAPADSTNDAINAVVHCFADNATSVDVILERDDNAGFTSATTVATISVTGVGNYWITSETAFSSLASDDYFRLRTANLSGTNFQIAAALGVAYA